MGANERVGVKYNSVGGETEGSETGRVRTRPWDWYDGSRGTGNQTVIPNGSTRQVTRSAAEVQNKVGNGSKTNKQKANPRRKVTRNFTPFRAQSETRETTGLPKIRDSASSEVQTPTPSTAFFSRCHSRLLTTKQT